MTDKPLVSILLPVYNVELYLPQCLDSVLNQTYTNLQIVLIDDGSIDKSLQLCQEYAAKDNRIEVYHQENQGVATTRNHLLKKVKGEYVLFVDSDDWIELDMVEFLLGKIFDNDVDMVTCTNIVNDNLRTDSVKSTKVYNQDNIICEFLRHTWFNGSLCNKLAKATLFHNETFHCAISYGEDALMTWKMLQKVKTVVVTNEQLYHYRKNPNSLSRSSWSPYKKGTGHQVWESISSDAHNLWPQYEYIARARFALEDFWGIYYATLSGYKYDEHIRLRQENIRKNFHNIHKAKLETREKIITAYMLSHYYGLGKLIKLIKA